MRQKKSKIDRKIKKNKNKHTEEQKLFAKTKFISHICASELFVSDFPMSAMSLCCLKNNAQNWKSDIMI